MMTPNTKAVMATYSQSFCLKKSRSDNTTRIIGVSSKAITPS